MSTWQKATRRGREIPGVSVRHQNRCAGPAKCNCRPSYRAQAWDKTAGRPVKSPSFKELAEAESWIIDFRRGVVAAPAERGGETFKELAERVLDGMETGRIGTKRHREGFSERTLQGYRSVLELHVYPKYGGAPAANLTVKDWQRLVDQLHEQGAATGTIANVINPVRTVYRYACSPARDTPLPINPTIGLEMPAKNEKRRERIAAPAEAAELLAALPIEDRIPFALATYAGMRRKEIRAARWEWIDFKAGTIDVKETKAGTGGIRTIPLVEPLRAILLEQIRTGSTVARIPTADLVCPPRRTGDSGLLSFDMLLKRAYRAWDAAGLQRIGLHDCRHTFASYLIAAGVNAKAVTVYLGHSSVDITFDRYGHLFPGNEEQAAEIVNDYLRRAAQ